MTQQDSSSDSPSRSTNPQAVGRKLRSVRALAGLSTRELAEITLIGHDTLRSIETGRARLSGLNAALIGAALGADPTSILTGAAVMEWNRKNPYSPASYQHWITNSQQLSVEELAAWRQSLTSLFQEPERISRDDPRQSTRLMFFLAATLEENLTAYCESEEQRRSKSVEPATAGGGGAGDDGPRDTPIEVIPSSAIAPFYPAARRKGRKPGHVS